jgi:hypothetical protein
MREQLYDAADREGRYLDILQVKKEIPVHCD